MVLMKHFIELFCVSVPTSFLLRAILRRKVEFVLWVFLSKTSAKVAHRNFLGAGRRYFCVIGVGGCRLLNLLQQKWRLFTNGITRWNHPVFRCGQTSRATSLSACWLKCPASFAPCRVYGRFHRRLTKGPHS